MSNKIHGAQDPSRPHPGTITARFAWNNSVEYWEASKLPESFTFRCYDKDGNPTSRHQAAWCVPVVEVVTVSMDDNGNPVAPKEAASISNSVYGPDHTFLEHTSSAPKQPR
ncbi:hypothetical protein LMG28688_02639 [Paraburkholderia caffeinitolerans]|uniref:Uncharacterized protein n=1 Tax=Paraburkholderia caffeinitolerans TaxID=1723730 RepID=A0A6J5FZ35_9BURK|nr:MULTISPECIES: hypothetical protein [Paraburkholderia]CAB3788195.1 hypothetical protein LMG28688_02639 [Paraburkholderia caffeinitolerans]